MLEYDAFHIVRCCWVLIRRHCISLIYESAIYSISRGFFSQLHGKEISTSFKLSFGIWKISWRYFLGFVNELAQCLTLEILFNVILRDPVCNALHLSNARRTAFFFLLQIFFFCGSFSSSWLYVNGKHAVFAFRGNDLSSSSRSYSLFFRSTATLRKPERKKFKASF